MNETLQKQDREKGNQGQGLMKMKGCILNLCNSIIIFLKIL